jgi:DnaJ-class molecular chaperone
MSPGKGNQDTRGQFGNLLLKIKIRPHDKFVRRGLHIVVPQPITIAQAVLGAKVQV